LSDRAVRYGMIVLDPAPAILRARGTPVYFVSQEETIEYARLHDIVRWIVLAIPAAGGRCTRRPDPSTRPRSPNPASTSPCVDSGPVCEHASTGRIARAPLINVRAARHEVRLWETVLRLNLRHRGKDGNGLCVG
jgi:hypothetical protein